MLKIGIILAISSWIALFAQTPTQSEVNADLSNFSDNDIERKELKKQLDLSFFKALANKDRIILQWALDGQRQGIFCRIYRSEFDKDNFVLISSSESNSRPLQAMHENNRYYFSDLAVVPGVTYWYKLVCGGESEEMIEHTPISASLPVQRTYSNRVVTTIPDRFRFETVSNVTDQSATTLQLDLPYQSQPHHPTKICIYGPKGEKVKTLYRGPMEAGSYQLIWSGDSEQGEMVDGGVFFAVFEDEFIKEATKLVLIR